MIVKNLWAKDLQPGDLIAAVDLVDSRYGKINRFTVERADDSGIADAVATLRAALS